MSSNTHDIKIKNYFILASAIVGSALTTYKLFSIYNEIHHANAPPKPKKNITELIGNTPMVRIESLSRYTGCEIYAKMELCNPGGSAKDRVALNIIKGNEERGNLQQKGDYVFEGTSGSTGISIAMICNSLGYKCSISLPDDTSLEKLALLESYGAEIVKVKPASIVDPNQYVNSAKKLCSEMNKKSTQTGVRGVFADQFENELNWEVHYKTTGPEILQQLDGEVDGFIAGCGTGGTIGGVSKYLKEQKADKVVTCLADPQGSGFYNRVKYGVMYDYVEKEGTRRRHQVDTLVEGIGLNRITLNFAKNEKYIDESYRVTDEEALKMARWLSAHDGLFIGSSTAINAVATLKLIHEYGLVNSGKKFVMIACDSGSRHLSKFWKEALSLELVGDLKEIVSLD